jgi:phospholipid-binding lipoprotein MlaA
MMAAAVLLADPANISPTLASFPPWRLSKERHVSPTVAGPVASVGWYTSYSGRNTLDPEMNRFLAISVALATLCMAGCASQNTKRDPRDPWERVNRVSYNVTDKVDRAVLKPVAKGYKAVTPDFVETGITNFFDNITYPRVFVNDLLQAKFNSALHDTGRFLLNTTIGVGGLFDPATSAGLEKNDEDFGQTLGKWGVPAGPYFFIPLMGPSTVRDTFGKVPDTFSNPTRYIDNTSVRYGLLGLDLINTRAQLLEAEKALGGVYDRYAILRSVYLQQREYKVRDGNVPEDKSLEEEFPDEPEDDSKPAPATPPAQPPKL